MPMQRFTMPAKQHLSGSRFAPLAATPAARRRCKCGIRKAIALLFLCVSVSLAGCGNSYAEAIEAAKKSGPRASSLTAELIDALERNNANDANDALTGLIEAGAEDAAVAAFMVTLETAGPNMRMVAVQGLDKIGEPAVPRLIEALDSKDENLRGQAAYALGWMQTKAAEAVPALAEALGDRSSFVRFRAATALALMADEADAAVPALREALGDEDARVRLQAAVALGEIGPPTEVVVADFGPLLDDRDRHVRMIAVDVLGRHGPEAVPSLTKGLRRGDETLCRLTIVTLTRMGPDAKAAAPALEQILNDRRMELRDMAARALASIRSEPAAAPRDGEGDHDDHGHGQEDMG